MDGSDNLNKISHRGSNRNAGQFFPPHKPQSLQAQGAGGSEGEMKERRLGNGPPSSPSLCLVFISGYTLLLPL